MNLLNFITLISKFLPSLGRLDIFFYKNLILLNVIEMVMRLMTNTCSNEKNTVNHTLVEMNEFVALIVKLMQHFEFEILSLFQFTLLKFT